MVYKRELHHLSPSSGSCHCILWGHEAVHGYWVLWEHLPDR